MPYQERGITFALLQSQLSQAGACCQDSAAAATHLSPPTEGLRTTFCLAPESASSSWCARCKGSAALQRSRGRGDAPVAARPGTRHAPLPCSRVSFIKLARVAEAARPRRRIRHRPPRGSAPPLPCSRVSFIKLAHSCSNSAARQRPRGRGGAPVAAHPGARHHTFALLESQLHQAGALRRGSAAAATHPSPPTEGLGTTPLPCSRVSFIKLARFAEAARRCRGSAALQRQHQDLPSPELARTYAIAEPQ